MISIPKGYKMAFAQMNIKEKSQAFRCMELLEGGSKKFLQKNKMA